MTANCAHSWTFCWGPARAWVQLFFHTADTSQSHFRAYLRLTGQPLNGIRRPRSLLSILPTRIFLTLLRHNQTSYVCCPNSILPASLPQPSASQFTLIFLIKKNPSSPPVFLTLQLHYPPVPTNHPLHPIHQTFLPWCILILTLLWQLTTFPPTLDPPDFLTLKLH